MAPNDENDDDETATHVMDRRVPPEKPKPRPSLWTRATDLFGRFAESVGETFFGVIPPLTPELPPVPPWRRRDRPLLSPESLSTQEQGEALLIAILRAPRHYQIAAIDVARRALFIKASGEQLYADFIVQFALSRITPDSQGRIEVTRLRDTLPFMMYSGAILPSLIRLEERKILRLVLGDNGGDPMTDILRERIRHIELRAPV